jgi:hypothetical protein
VKYTLIVPPSYKTAVTGFVMGAVKTVGKTEWRVEIYAGERFPRIHRAGEAQLLSALPALIVRLSNALCAQHAQLAALRAA